MEIKESKQMNSTDAISVPVGGEVMKHNLPQIPSAVAANPRMAVSKASVKNKESPSPSKPFASVKTVETNNEVDKLVTPEKIDQTKPPSSLPTPPSEGTPSENSPKTNKETVDECASSTKESTAQGDTTAIITNKDTPNTSVNPVNQKKTPRAKTKGDIKKQLMKKKGQRDDQKDDVSSCSSDTPVPPKKEVPSQEGCKYVLADMFWAKVGGHPWWPCMVAYDPFDSIFYKRTGLDTGRVKSLYHVQFFGQEGERGWITESKLIPYEGTASHIKWLEEHKAKARKSDKKDYEMANKRRRPAWDIACAEAEEAFTVEKAERRARFTLSYSPLKKPQNTVPVKAATDGGKKSTKRKLSVDGDSNAKQSPPKKRRKKGKSISISPMSKDAEKLANQKLTQFMVYCSKKRDAVRREHPTYSDTQIEKALKGQWDQLADEEKQKFIPMGSDVKNVSQMLPEESDGTKRPPKPSKKKIESEESGGIVKKKKVPTATLR